MGKSLCCCLIPGIFLIISSNLLGQAVLGDTNIEPTPDYHWGGRAEAFQLTAVNTATLTSLVLFVDPQSTVSQIAIGLYDDVGGQPSTLLTQATFSPQINTWNTVNVAPVLVNQGTNYWVAVMGLAPGYVFMRTHGYNCNSVGSPEHQQGLTSTWSTQRFYGRCLLSAYGTGQGTGNQITLSISPTSVSLPVSGIQQFSATVTGTTNTAVSWATSGGSITPTGLYTAPGTVGTYTVTATSLADTTQSSTATVTVTSATPHSVTLTWNNSPSPGIVGYNVYRGMQPNGPYTLINSGLIANLTYDDLNVQSGQTYYYVATAVDSNGVESAYSDQASATVP